MSKHTPGPWALEVYEQTEEWEGECCITIGEGKDQDEVFVHDEVNGRLIAAAPDLYEALAVLHTLLDFDDEVVAGVGIVIENPDRINHAFELARAALRKARGKEQ